MSYLNEKLFVAVVGMAKSNADLRTRLVDAYTFSLMHADHPQFDYPADIQEKLDELRAAFSKVEDSERGSAAASVDGMTDREVEEHIETICGLIFDLEVKK